jgi:hypothetical protein
MVCGYLNTIRVPTHASYPGLSVQKVSVCGSLLDGLDWSVKDPRSCAFHASPGETRSLQLPSFGTRSCSRTASPRIASHFGLVKSPCQLRYRIIEHTPQTPHLKQYRQQCRRFLAPQRLYAHAAHRVDVRRLDHNLAHARIFQSLLCVQFLLDPPHAHHYLVGNHPPRLLEVAMAGAVTHQTAGRAQGLEVPQEDEDHDHLVVAQAGGVLHRPLEAQRYCMSLKVVKLYAARLYNAALFRTALLTHTLDRRRATYQKCEGRPSARDFWQVWCYQRP